jgi:formylglycine-generating enzyme
VRYVFAFLMALLPLMAALPLEARTSCPSDMALVGDEVCVDRFEAALVDVSTGDFYSPYKSPGTSKVKAISRAGVVPQAYISKNEAEAACKVARKRLCKEAEWLKACQGKSPTLYPYGDEHKEGYCNDAGKAPLATYYHDGDAYSSAAAMNDERLNQLPGTVAKTGRFKKCRNGFGLHDMVGNVHEWVDDPNGTFRGGYYLDTKQNGEGCKYKTGAHDVSYHDYSTGFRCCKDPRD